MIKNVYIIIDSDAIDMEYIPEQFNSSFRYNNTGDKVIVKFLDNDSVTSLYMHETRYTHREIRDYLIANEADWNEIE